MKRALASDWIKMRRTWVVPLVILGPLGVVGLTAIRSATNWPLLIQNIGHLLMPSLVLGVALLAALIAGIEHDGHAWKQLFAAPVPRGRLYVSKLLWIECLLGISATLGAVGTIMLGVALGFHAQVPWGSILIEFYYPYLAATGMLAVQLAVSMLLPNQAFAITLGVLGVIASGLCDALTPAAIARAAHVVPFLPVPWIYPSLSAITHGTVQHPQVAFVVSGLVLGAAVTWVGNWAFAAREVQ